MLGRTPGTISAIRPLKDGVIADFDVTEQMLRHFIQKVHQHRFAHPRVVVCVPSGVTGVEKRAVEEATLNAGARKAYLIEEPMAAAIGAGLPVAEPTGNMIVDIGGGTTEVAVISLGGIVVSQSLRVGGDEMDEAIINHIKREYKLLIGQQTAEEIKLEVGSAHRDEGRGAGRGSRAATCSRGLPKTVILSSEEVRHALEEPVNQIIDAIKSTLDKTPPELAADIMDRGIVLAGGGALLQGLDERLRHETHMPVHLAESPLTCVAVGSGRSLEEFDAIHRSRARPRRATAARGIERRASRRSTRDCVGRGAARASRRSSGGPGRAAPGEPMRTTAEVIAFLRHQPPTHAAVTGSRTAGSPRFTFTGRRPRSSTSTCFRGCAGGASAARCSTACSSGAASSTCSRCTATIRRRQALRSLRGSGSPTDSASCAGCST